MRKIGIFSFEGKDYTIHLSSKFNCGEIRYCCFSKITLQLLEELCRNHGLVINSEIDRRVRGSRYVANLRGSVYLFRALITDLEINYQVNWLK